MTKKASITTGVGDSGNTFLFSGEQIRKDDPRTEAYGGLDELVSVLGTAFATSERAEVREAVEAMQRKLFVAGAELATSLEHIDGLPDRIDGSDVEALTEIGGELESAIEMPSGFVLPGGTLAAAQLDHARTLARRLERKAVALTDQGLLDSESLLVWLNRLSDCLWLLARLEEGPACRWKDA